MTDKFMIINEAGLKINKTITSESSSSNQDYKLVNAFVPTLSAPPAESNYKRLVSFTLGKSDTSRHCVMLGYNHMSDVSDTNDNYANLGISGASDAMKIYYNRIECSKPLYATSIGQISDIRFKENIQTLATDDSEELIKKLRVCSFKFKPTFDDEGNEVKDENVHYGLIAQDVQKVAPELVSENNNRLSVNYIELIPHLINIIQSQQKQIDDLNIKMKKLTDLISITTN